MTILESNCFRFIITKPRGCKGSLDLQFHVKAIYSYTKNYAHLDGRDIFHQLTRYKAIPEGIVPKIYRDRIRLTEDEMSKVVDLIKEKVL